MQLATPFGTGTLALVLTLVGCGGGAGDALFSGGGTDVPQQSGDDAGAGGDRQDASEGEAGQAGVGGAAGDGEPTGAAGTSAGGADGVAGSDGADGGQAGGPVSEEGGVGSGGGGAGGDGGPSDAQAGCSAASCPADQVCCSSLVGSSCLDANAICLGTKLGCDSAASCGQGEQCCGQVMRVSAVSFFTEFKCQAKCNGLANQHIACDPNAPVCPAGLKCHPNWWLLGYAICDY